MDLSEQGALVTVPEPIEAPSEGLTVRLQPAMEPALSLRGWVAPDLAARSLAISADNARLYALADDGVHTVDLVSGRDAGTAIAVPGPAGSVRAIHLLASADPAARR